MRLPKLNAFQTFSVVARHGGFTAASLELNITPAAVSHQIKLLENQLGIQLFHRLPNGLQLTEAGRELLPEISKGITHFEQGIKRLHRSELSGRLIVNAAPTLASLWLLPRLRHFTDTYPEIELQLLTNESGPELASGLADIRIVHSTGHFQGLCVRKLMDDPVSPVCSPDLLSKVPVSCKEDLLNHTLLHDVNVQEGEAKVTWEKWLSDGGVDPAGIKHQLGFGSHHLQIQAAVQGYGIALGRLALIQSHLAEGTLVQPISTETPSGLAYYTVTTNLSAQKPRVSAFLDWVHQLA